MTNLAKKLGFGVVLVTAGLVAFSGCGEKKKPATPKYAHEGVSDTGIVTYIDFVKTPEEIRRKNDSTKSEVTIFNQRADGGAFLSGGGDIHNNIDGNMKGMVIKMQPLDTALAERIIYTREDGIGVPCSILRDYISRGDTITFDGLAGVYSSKSIRVYNPEQIVKVN